MALRRMWARHLQVHSLFRLTRITAILLAVLVPSFRADAFALLGPYPDWQDAKKSYHKPGDIGGPMNIGEGYRWNMPVITYGFSRSFLNYFGSNGVAAVESAMALLNQIPPASVLDLEDYPFHVIRVNFRAQALKVVDLKSRVIQLLLEEMGLGDPVRWTFCVRDVQMEGTNSIYYVVSRNFDPSSAATSPFVNDVLFTYYIYAFGGTPTASNFVCDASEARIDPLQPFSTAVAQPSHDPGLYINRLTRDDVGGLRYLLSGSQIRVEALLPDVYLVATNGSLVRTATRPGVEKLTFIRHPTGALSGEFVLYTNRWTDIYYDGDFPAYQNVERVTIQPDILFSGQDLGVELPYTRTGTSNWVNHAALNGNSGGAGPGVITPPIFITFNTAGPFRLNFPNFMDEVTSIELSWWGSFDGSTNSPIIYPDVAVTFQSSRIGFKLILGSTTNELSWKLAGPAYGRFWFQTATNLADWTTLTTITNSGTNYDFEFSAMPYEPKRFFRTIPEP
jgi:hypothetical protein